MNVEKEARRDAQEFARSQMYYGEGAGTRRKLISATVESKSDRNDRYARAFRQELAHQDMAEHAIKARKERERHDRAQMVQRNVRGLTSGNYQNLSTGVLIVGAVAYFAHQTGIDRQIYDKARTKLEDYKRRRRLKKAGIRL